MSEILTPVVYQLGVGGVLGFFVGYAIKKLTKLLAVLGGLFALLLIYLGYQGVLSVNYGRLAEAVQGAIGSASQALNWLTPIVANLPFAGSFMMGMVAGLKIG